jgi:hypothetical protein
MPGHKKQTMATKTIWNWGEANGGMLTGPSLNLLYIHGFPLGLDSATITSGDGLSAPVPADVAAIFSLPVSDIVEMSGGGWKEVEHRQRKSERAVRLGGSASGAACGLGLLGANS